MEIIVEKPSRAPLSLRLKKCPGANDSSILFKHVTARLFRFVYHYHPKIEFIRFVDGEDVEFVGDSSQTFEAGQPRFAGQQPAAHLPVPSPHRDVIGVQASSASNSSTSR